MRLFFANFKTIFGEFIGLILGLLWAISTKWDYEPLIVFIISGVGLFVSILSLIFKKKNAEQAVIPNINNSKYENPDLDITNIDPKTIINQIQSAPPFQQEDIANHFIGINVIWNLKLLMIHKSKKNEIIVSMRPVEDTYEDIEFRTDTEKYPIFKIAEKNKAFEVTGKIIKCRHFNIELDLITLKEK